MNTQTINPNLIFGPVFALAGLVALVIVLMLRERIRQYTSQRLHPQKAATRAEFAAAIKDTRCADNYSNLFESPVLFYVVCLGLYITQTVTAVALGLAWIYVLLRMAHTRVHCGSNHVMTRFKLFAASLMALVALWLVWAWALMGL